MPNASRSKTHAAGWAGSGGNSDQVRPAGLAPEGPGEPQHHLLVPPEAQPGDDLEPARRGSGGVKVSTWLLRTPSGTATTTCEPVSVRPDSEETHTPSSVRSTPVHRPVEAYVEPGRHGIHDGDVPVLEAGHRSSRRRTRPASTATPATAARPPRQRPLRHSPEVPGALAAAARRRARSWPGTPRSRRLRRRPGPTARAGPSSAVTKPPRSPVRVAPRPRAESHRPVADIERRQGRQRIAGTTLDTCDHGRSDAAGSPTGGAARSRRDRPASLPRPGCAADLRPVGGPRAPRTPRRRGGARWRPSAQRCLPPPRARGAPAPRRRRGPRGCRRRKGPRIKVGFRA